MTTASKKENQHPQSATQDADQILHLKRLLVTLKQHYEKSLQQLQIELQDEQNQRLNSQKELEKTHVQLIESQQLYEEEIESLRVQQNTLKEILKKSQEELHQLKKEANKQEENTHSHFEKDYSFLNHQLEITSLEAEQLREEVKDFQNKIRALEQELAENQYNSQKEIDQLKQTLEDQKLHDDNLETVVSENSTHRLRREIEIIKQTLLDNANETKELETRYLNTLNEKTELDHQCKQLKLQFENQSANLIAFQEKLHAVETQKHNIELHLQAKKAEWIESCQQRQELNIRIESLNAIAKEKDFIQDKYELLKEEWKQAVERLEEAIDERVRTHNDLHQLEGIAANQLTQLQEFNEQVQLLNQEKDILESEKEQLRTLLEESEARLKVAQQHLAKKVKEAALLNEKLEDTQTKLQDFNQIVENQKSQIAQLQASVDLYQRQEVRLQEQLHEALKGTEGQILKWEEKYFKMYDKWQESENRNRELKKFEEKHLQMQSLLSNLGNFMGGGYHSTNALFHAAQEIDETKTRQAHFAFEKPHEEEFFDNSKQQTEEEKFNLFGMKEPPSHLHDPRNGSSRE